MMMIMGSDYTFVISSMGFLQNLFWSSFVASFVFFLSIIPFRCWISPTLALRKLRANGFRGPTPKFPFGNLHEMSRGKKTMSTSTTNTTPPSSKMTVTHDIHALVSPFYVRWQKSYGKVFMYWLGTEPFLYVADPEFLRKMSAGVAGKSWGKPEVFKKDREAMFGNGLNMAEGDQWVQHRHILNPTFSPANIKGLTNLIVNSTKDMIDRWTTLINSGKNEINVEAEASKTAGQVIGKTIFGLSYENGGQVFEKFSALQVALYSTHFVGVPYGKFLNLSRTLNSKRLGKEIDKLLLQIILDRKNRPVEKPEQDMLGLLLKEGQAGQTLTIRELVDECKTIFFGGNETTAVGICWSLLMLALHPEWQDELRKEIREVVGDKEVDSTIVGGLKKMEWVIKEVIRLYSPAPNAQRQVREDMPVDGRVIPKGTNVWIDVVSMHHDQELWGEDVNEFKPERFKDDQVYGGCKHKMGYLPFGFGGRMCIGRNLTMMESKIVLTLVLSKFSLSVSPSYVHRPTTLLSLRPAHGMPLLVKAL